MANTARNQVLCWRAEFLSFPELYPQIMKYKVKNVDIIFVFFKIVLPNLIGRPSLSIMSVRVPMKHTCVHTTVKSS